MADIFFSYSSKDRGRVQNLHDALVDYGFTVFWDQEVPTGSDWDTWIRRHLMESKCAVVVWSANSISSDNVRHEARIAKQQNKLVPVLIEPVSADQLPMGMDAMQTANLNAWTGDLQHAEWLKVLREIELKLTPPPWVQRRIDLLEAALVAERARREGAERWDGVLREQIAKEARAQQDVRAERDRALHEADTLKSALEDARQQQAAPESRIAELTKQLADAAHQFHIREERARYEIHRLRTAVEELRADRDDRASMDRHSVATAAGSRGQSTTRWRIGASFFGAALTLMIWTVAFQIHHPEDSLFTFVDASLALVALGTALVLMRGDQPFTTWILLIATWGLFGSALTLAVLTSVFGVHYPTDYLIGRNYFITFGELVVCVPLLRLESQRRRRERWAMEEVAVVTPTRRERSE